MPVDAGLRMSESTALPYVHQGVLWVSQDFILAKSVKKTCTYIYGGERGIRTLDELLTHTHFPGVRLRPLGHLSYSVPLGSVLRLEPGKNRHLSHIPAHEFAVTVAPFQAWRSSQLFVARGPR